MSTNRWIQPILAPGIRLMQRYRMSAKLAALSALVVLPLSAVTVWRTAERLEALHITQGELRGVGLARQSTQVLNDLHAVRLALARSADTVSSRDRLAANVEVLQHEVAAHRDGILSERWRNLHEQLLAASRAPKAGDAPPLEVVNQAADGMLQWLMLVGERSALLLDPEAGAYFLVDLGIERMPAWTESVSRSGSLGAALIRARRPMMSTTPRACKPARPRWKPPSDPSKIVSRPSTGRANKPHKAGTPLAPW